MIVETDSLGTLAGTVTMVDGGFDPIHPGHIAYLRAAAELGLPVLCNVSSDDWVGRKHAPLLAQAQRCAVIDAIRYVEYTHPSSVPTVDVLSIARPRYYAKGSDWHDRLPADELEVCARNDIEVVFLETVLDSSTAILTRYLDRG